MAPGSPKSPHSKMKQLHSSPSRPDSYGVTGRKERRLPSITPRKFTRFFTPRSHGSLISISSRRALFDITTPANNNSGTQSSPIRATSSISEGDYPSTTFTREMKRRKLMNSTGMSPGLEHDKYFPSAQFSSTGDNITDDSKLPDSSHGLQVSDRDAVAVPTALKDCSVRVARIGERDLVGQLSELNLRNSTTMGRRHLTYPTSDWHVETEGFYSRPEDTHLCTSIESSARSIPFCVAGCNTNSLVAVGDEEGHVRLIESAQEGKPSFKDVYLAFRPHTNAVIDISFSLDDSLLATASGDQTARIIDMATQTTISVLALHSASLKQVKFQPGAANNSVIATSSRDGSVHIWDLRCTGAEGPVHQIHMPLNPVESSRARNISLGHAVHSIYDAHRPAIPGRPAQSIVPRDGPSRGEIPGRIGDVSITAISFLPHGQQHLLLTASEANASVKLWDIRSLHNTRRKNVQPLSCTAQPNSHSQWRSFGINSISLSGDGARLYALCRDNTVYAYSTAHLMLGRAPALSASGNWRGRKAVEVQEGLGPLYGFRHNQLHATSFYVKSAIRPPKNGKEEMLAVGSCDGCAVLFPTDEKYLETYQHPDGPELELDPGVSRPRLKRSGSNLAVRLDDGLRISESGTPLIRGHDGEVGALSWTSDGELVTVGDDFLVRCWREGKKARDLRVGGEHGGQRWGCGWADVPAVYDDDDDDNE